MVLVFRRADFFYICISHFIKLSMFLLAVWTKNSYIFDGYLQKGTIVAGFKPPYYLNLIHCDGEYRIQLLIKTEQIYNQLLLIAAGSSYAARSPGVAEMKLICRDAEELVDCLRMLYQSTYEWTMMNSTPKEHQKENRDIKHWAKDTPRSIVAQKQLAAMDRKAFDVYSVAADGGIKT